MFAKVKQLAYLGKCAVAKGKGTHRDSYFGKCAVVRVKGPLLR